MSSLPAVPDVAKREALEPGFVNAFVEMAQRIGVDPDYLAASVSIESGFNPAARNKDSGASGLIQWMPQYAPLFGTSVEAIRQMTAIEQLPLIERTFKHWGHLAPRDTYLAIFWPAAVGKPDDYVIATEGQPSYNQNSGLDWDKDGTITADDVRRIADARLASAHGFRVEGGVFVPGKAMNDNGSADVALLALVGAGGLAWILSRRAS